MPEPDQEAQVPAADRLELLERRLAERVDARVRVSLFKFYGAIGAAVAVVLGYVGFNIVQQTMNGLRQEARDAAQRIIVDTVKPIAGDAEKSLLDVQVKMRVFDEMQRRTLAALDALERNLANFQPQARNLEETIAKVQDLESRRRDLQARIESVASLTGSLEDIAGTMTELARKVDGLNAAVAALSDRVGAKTVAADTAALQTGIGAVVRSSERVQSAVEAVQRTEAQTTVYFQHAAMAPELVDAITQALRRERFKVPGSERVSMPAAGMSEVRYFWPGDRGEAERLAGVATAAMEKQGQRARQVAARDYTGWSRAKPPAGTVELWLGLPATAAQ